MWIGPYDLGMGLVLAPMAGVTDQPFRRLCLALGADLAVAEMVSSDTRLWHTAKSRHRLRHGGECRPRSVQIVGADPRALAEAARLQVAAGADIIDINMGCPAKKVCNVAAGSALLRDEPLVGRLLDAVVAAVAVPVTLKIRTGWDAHNRNGLRVARIAEQAGVAALAVHGRTRACAFRGAAEYDTIAEIKAAVRMPVLANGDVDTPERALQVLRHTGADGLLIGRAAQGNPWIFRETRHYLSTGRRLPPPDAGERAAVVLSHLEQLHAFYGETSGVRLARKHLRWYCRAWPGAATFWAHVNRVETAGEQLRLTRDYLYGLPDAGARAA